LSGKYTGLQQSNELNEKAVRLAVPEFGYQESQLVACLITPRHADLRVLAKHIVTIAGRSARCK
jgi:hypothetical protein